MLSWQDGISYFSFDISDNWGERQRDNLHNFQAHIKVRSVVFLKVQREVTTLNRINISKSSWSPWLLWQITEEWIGKTHLHCSETAGWSNLKRKIPFTRLKCNLLSHTKDKYVSGTSNPGVNKVLHICMPLKNNNRTHGDVNVINVFLLLTSLKRSVRVYNEKKLEVWVTLCASQICGPVSWLVLLITIYKRPQRSIICIPI